MRTLHLLTTDSYERRGVGAYPTRAAAEAEIVRRVLNGEGADLSEGTEIVAVDVPTTPAESAGKLLAEAWARVQQPARDAVDAGCGGLVPLLDALVAATEVDLDELRARLTS